MVKDLEEKFSEDGSRKAEGKRSHAMEKNRRCTEGPGNADVRT